MYSTEIEPVSTHKKKPLIALVGNPNCGKSTVFNQLTGLRQKTGNFPGVTVDKKVGKTTLPSGRDIQLIDLPGAYNLFPTSMDERVVLNVLANPKDETHPDAVLYIADVTQLEKHLLLFTQIMDLGIPVLLALNMTDAAKEQHLQYHADKLSHNLGVPVVPISGRRGENFDELQQEMENLLETPRQPHRFYHPSEAEKAIGEKVTTAFGLSNPFLGLLWAQNALHLSFLSKSQKKQLSDIVTDSGFNGLSFQVREVMQRFDRFPPLLEKTIIRNKHHQLSATARIDRIITHRIFGPLIFFALMLMVFQAIYSWSSYPMDLIEGGIGQLSGWIQNTLPAGWFTSLLTDGIIAGLGGILVFVPQIAILFFLISLLEEVGYMARAVFMFDHLMQRFGLNGRSVVALVSSGACAIPAIMSTRTISNWKERLITIFVSPFISCSARIPVYTVLIGFVVPAATVWGFFNLQGIAFMGLYLLGIVAALASGWLMKKMIKTEERSFLLLELPEYRRPVLQNVFLTVWEKVKAFTLEAGKIILLISIILWGLASYGPGDAMNQAEQQATELAQQNNFDEAATNDLVASQQLEASYAGHLGKFIEPVIRPLGFDWKMGIAIISSFAAREVFIGTMATIYSIGSTEDEGSIRDRMAREKDPLTGEPVYNLATSLSLLIFYVFAMMCMSTLAVVRRETGSWKWPILQFLFMTGLAYVSALAVYQFLTW